MKPLISTYQRETGSDLSGSDFVDFVMILYFALNAS